MSPDTSQPQPDAALLDAIAARRNDADFMRRLRDRITEDKPLLDRMAECDQFVHAVEPGWVDSVLLTSGSSPIHPRVLIYADGTMRIEHKCRVVDGHLIVTAPALHPTHVVEQRDPLTITPSIDCPDCPLHGHIVKGAWLDA